MNYKIKMIIFFCVISFSIQKLEAQTATTKNNIAFVDGYVFEDQQYGVTKYVAIQKNVVAEFKPRENEILGMQAKMETLKKQIESNVSNPVEKQKKADEYDNLYRSAREKSESYKIQIEKRYRELLKPVQERMGAAIKQWSTQKGFTAVVDVAKDDKGMFLWMDETVVNATTAELIKYINSVL
jgi:Skp family chaperone for outer membrane proteins